MPGTFCSKETLNLASVFFLTLSMKASFLNVVEPSGKIPHGYEANVPGHHNVFKEKVKNAYGKNKKKPRLGLFLYG